MWLPPLLTKRLPRRSSGDNMNIEIWGSVGIDPPDKSWVARTIQAQGPAKWISNQRKWDLESKKVKYFSIILHYMKVKVFSNHLHCMKLYGFSNVLLHSMKIVLWDFQVVLTGLKAHNVLCCSLSRYEIPTTLNWWMSTSWHGRMGGGQGKC